MVNLVSFILTGLGLILLIFGIIGVYGVIFSQSPLVGIFSIFIPIITLAFIFHEEGIKHWGRIVLGVVLLVIGLVIHQ